MATGCVFCDGDGGRRVWADDRCRIVLTDEPFAGFCRVVWNAHVREMTDLNVSDRDHLMRAVYATEAALRRRLAPDKVNLASLGNAVPHVHWHVIPRFVDDSHFPEPVWCAARRAGGARKLPAGFAGALAADLAAALGPGTPAKDDR
jgi:diadenosine tetraphosphate (Ap4A) HIT family hydrolase